MADPAARVRAAEAVRLARSGMSLSAAARQAGTTVPTVRRHFGSVVRRRRGRLTVQGSDDVTFAMRVTTTDGTQAVDVEGSAQRSIVAAHHNAIDEYLRTGNREPLADFEGVIVGDGAELETDPERLFAAWRSGEFDFLEIYQST